MPGRFFGVCEGKAKDGLPCAQQFGIRRFRVARRVGKAGHVEVLEQRLCRVHAKKERAKGSSVALVESSDFP